jgi:hypothetical protein
LISTYRNEHKYFGAPLVGCASCGIQVLEGGKVQYKQVLLGNNECKEHFVVSHGNVKQVCYIDIPIDSNGTTSNVNVWDVSSHYYSKQQDKTFFFHPELVTSDVTTNDHEVA